MKDLSSLMKQAQEVQQKLADAQNRLAELEVEGASGGGMVNVTLSGTGELKKVRIDPSLMQPGEADVLEDLVVAAHGDAKRKLGVKQAELMREAAGPLGAMGLPGLGI
ncbi:MAG: YbaB/EbfC family nucleoid-associated protein [Phenylobacterium sp.]